jgi:hypothetical protein
VISAIEHVAVIFLLSTSASNREKLGTDLEIGPVDLSDGGKEEKVKDPNLVDWDGPDDPENPLNWTSKRKITATCSSTGPISRSVPSFSRLLALVDPSTEGVSA